jgi:hypothetical protein
VPGGVETSVGRVETSVESVSDLMSGVLGNLVKLDAGVPGRVETSVEGVSDLLSEVLDSGLH